MDAEKLQLAETIDTWVQDIVRQSSSDEQADERILTSMGDYMGPFKQLLDTCTKLEMNLLIQRYDGFYRFANLLERLAQAIQDGVIEVPEDAHMPPGWGTKSQRPRKKRPRRARLFLVAVYCVLRICFQAVLPRHKESCNMKNPAMEN